MGSIPRQERSSAAARCHRGAQGCGGPACLGPSAEGPAGRAARCGPLGLCANGASGGGGPSRAAPSAAALTACASLPQSHSSYLEVGQCGSSQDASREGVSLSSHSSRRSSHTTLSDSTCTCPGLGAERPPQSRGPAGRDRGGRGMLGMGPTHRVMTSDRAETEPRPPSCESRFPGLSPAEGHGCWLWFWGQEVTR